MAVEIEIKAWVRRPEETRALVEKICVFQADYVKEDVYFDAPGGSAFAARPAPHLRVRREGEGWVCTYKEKSVTRGLEVNDENEFAVSDGPLFMRLLETLGCARGIRKVKRGGRYRGRGLTVEVSEVEGLGLFVEAEKVLPSASAEEIRAWEKTIRSFLADIGIREEDIEEKPYSVLLAENS